MTFEGKTVVVTGGARGIGDAVLEAFLEQGANGVSLDVIDPGAPRQGVEYVRADVTDQESVRGAFATLDRVDVLVNNAGIQRVGLVGELDLSLWRSVLATHLDGAFHCCTEAVPRMRAQGGGAIVTVASVAAFLGLPGRSPYSAAKAALTALTRVLAVETAHAGIRVNAVAPGFTRTPLVEQAFQDGSLVETWMVERIPMRRLGTPAEIARTIRFLASEEAAYVTGQVLVVDGGWTIQGINEAPGWLGGADVREAG
jgi:NAD(P)-dependent dehydrogenase (short-subunit alcohol dehydrogenase family)